MWSATAAVVAWTESKLGVRVGTYPPKDMPDDFAVVTRVGGDCEYPHDSPRFSIQVWTDTDEGAEQTTLALCAVLGSIAAEDSRINGVGIPSVTSIGHDASGHFIWQLTFELYCNIRED